MGRKTTPTKCDKKEDLQIGATATFFPHLLTLTQKEKLNPKAMITYKRPVTIGQKLINKDLALNRTEKQIKGGLRPCKRCALCGYYGKNNNPMAPNVSQFMTKNKTFPLNQNLTCTNYGIYVVNLRDMS